MKLIYIIGTYYSMISISVTLKLYKCILINYRLYVVVVELCFSVELNFSIIFDVCKINIFYMKTYKIIQYFWPMDENKNILE